MVMMEDKDIKEYHNLVNKLETMNNKRKETKYIVIHSSESSPKEDFDVKDIDTQHRKDGLFSCAFHKIIKRDGTIQDGRDIQIAGAHIADGSLKLSNKNSIGVCLVGGKSIDGQPDCNFTFKQYTALVTLIKKLKQDYNEVDVVGHRDVTDSVSPHFDVTELLR
tara:strand:- start:76 stop:567 length:492 start_codon:yes stop_codon:yes gene_type:complete